MMSRGRLRRSLFTIMNVHVNDECPSRCSACVNFFRFVRGMCDPSLPTSAGRCHVDIWVPWSMSRGAEVWDFAGSSLPRFFLALLRFPLGRRCLKSKLPSVISRTLRPKFWPSEPPFVRSFWRHAVGSGLPPYVNSSLRPLPSNALFNAYLKRCPRTSALELHSISCTLQRESSRAILRRSPEVGPSASGLVGDQLVGSGWYKWSNVLRVCS